MGVATLISKLTKRLNIGFLTGVLPLDKARIPTEIAAGVTLATLAVPTVMGYTKIAGTPVITGLYTMLIPALLFALFCSSKHLVVSADSATAAILASGLAGMAAHGSLEYVALAGLLAIMVGVLLLLASWIGLGFMADFLSRTVLIGFLTGVGIQSSLRAITELYGLPAPDLDTIATLWTKRSQFGHPDPAVLIVAGIVVFVILSGRYLERRTGRAIPGALIAIVGAIAASWWFDLRDVLPVVGEVPAGLPEPVLNRVKWHVHLFQELLPTAFAMVIVILAQSAATARAYAALHGEHITIKQDLTALGFANIGAGLTGTFVVNGSPTQTEMVHSAGGRSQLALVVACVVVLLILLFLTEPLGLLPDAVLSAVVFLIGLKLINIKGMMKIRRERPSEYRIALLTAAIVVVLGVEQGIIVAVVLSLILHTRHGYHPNNQLLIKNEKGNWRAKDLESGAQAAPGLLIYHFNHSMYYANAGLMKQEIQSITERGWPELRWLCIDVSAVDDIDFTASETLADLVADLGKKSVKVVFVQEVRHINSRTRRQLLERMPEQIIFKSLKKLLAAYGDSQQPSPPQTTTEI